MKLDRYETEISNGTKGFINIPVGSKFTDILKDNEFIKDSHTESYVRSDAIVRFEYVGIINFIEVT